MERRTMLGFSLATLVGSTSLAESAGATTPPAVVRAGEDHDGPPRRIGVSATTYKVVTRETGGALFVIEQANQRRGGPPLHVHHGEDELFYVLAGDYIVQVGDRRNPLGAGDCILGPRGVPHAWAFVGSGTGRLLLSFAPAGKMEAYFNAWEQLGFTPGGYSQDKDAALLRAYGMERRGPPIPV